MARFAVGDVAIVAATGRKDVILACNTLNVGLTNYKCLDKDNGATYELNSIELRK
jgi:hypothetical protein